MTFGQQLVDWGLYGVPALAGARLKAVLHATEI